MKQIEMVLVQGGTFLMGATKEQDTECDEDKKTVHEVTLSDFYIGKYLVTQKEWIEVMGSNRSNRSCFKGDDLPVENITWDRVQKFISKLNKKTGKTYRLPTEAEWEFAARGGTKSQGFEYAGSNNLNEVAWYYSNSKYKTHPVGQKKPNELGLYDMSGNVWEWCNDWYGDLSSDVQTNPQGPATGCYRVYRGGSWGNYPPYCRVAIRYFIFPDFRYYVLGFRLAMSI